MKAGMIFPLLLLALSSVVPGCAFLAVPSTLGTIAVRDVNRLQSGLGALGARSPSSPNTARQDCVLRSFQRRSSLASVARSPSATSSKPQQLERLLKGSPFNLWSSFRRAFGRLSNQAARLSLTFLLVLSAFVTSARPARAVASPSLSSYDPSAPALHLPGAESYVKKFMWSVDKYNLFESAYLGADKQLTGDLGSRGKFGVSGAMVGKLLVEAGPSLAVGGLIVGGGVGAVKLDRYMKGVKEKWREEEIELYGEELTVDATPVEMPDVELPDEDEDDTTDKDLSEGGEN
ncbi:hypothetical protein TrVE_jg2795 [Triparma verrucosa]|uniref:Uncharacterized protein n=1 Tax=Triparma verrucosa TaxID=1606542 RepID=A0A9W7BK71_9STRA|nr:hypothetical protein TrVE_jg2795 [Triparma verrucosa]